LLPAAAGKAPRLIQLSVSHFLLDTGVLNQAPKGRNSLAQAEGLGEDGSAEPKP